jgi:hypothetical protein
MNDSDIRAVLHSRLETRHGGDPKTRIVDELGVLMGDSRVDVAVINGKLEGFEIKSDRDRLVRLPRQADAYSQVFDRMTVVCCERHAAGVALCVPDWWGIEVARSGNRGTRIVRLRSPRANPGVEPGAVVQLLWRDEALDELERIDRADGLRSKPREVLWGALADALPPRTLRAVVRDRLRARKDWRVRG